MRRRVFPLVLTAAAGVVALVRRSRRRQPPIAPRYVAQPAKPALAAPDSADDVAIDGQIEDRDPMPHPQVEGESAPRARESAAKAIHNASPRSPFRSVAWALLDDEPGADATALRIGFSLVARHESLARIDVRETSSQVFVTVLARFEPPAGGWFAYAEARKATVDLRAPLGDRALVHAPVDEPTTPPSDAPAG